MKNMLLNMQKIYFFGSGNGQIRPYINSVVMTYWSEDRKQVLLVKLSVIILE